MDNINTRNSGNGISFLGALQIAFIVLKLVGVINWSWWMVLLPAIIPLAIIISVVVAQTCIALIARIAL